MILDGLGRRRSSYLCSARRRTALGNSVSECFDLLLFRDPVGGCLRSISKQLAWPQSYSGADYNRQGIE